MKKIFIIKFTILFFANSFAQKDVFIDAIKDGTKSIKVENQKHWAVPDYVKTQFAGNIGLISVGAGYQLFNKVVYTELLYGFVPKSVSKTDEIHLITIKNTFPIFRKEIGKNFSISPIAGFATTYDIGTNSFTTLPGFYPKGYYVPNAFHFTFFGGAMVHKDCKDSKMIKGADFYLELGTVDTYLWYVITSEEVSISDVFSTSIGINFYF
jgi:hypothetical protein